MDHCENRGKQTLHYSGLKGNSDPHQTVFLCFPLPLSMTFFSSLTATPDSMQTPPPSRHRAQRTCPLLLVLGGQGGSYVLGFETDS